MKDGQLLLQQEEARCGAFTGTKKFVGALCWHLFLSIKINDRDTSYQELGFRAREAMASMLVQGAGLHAMWLPWLSDITTAQ